MDTLAIGLEAAALVFALGLSSYAHFLSRTFKGGVLENPFRILTVSGMLFVGAAVYQILGEFEIVSSFMSSTMSSSFEALFLLTLFWGFYRIANVWRQTVGEKVQRVAIKEA